MLRYLDAVSSLLYRHHIDIFNGTAIRGWVMQSGRPHAPSLVAAFHEGRRISAITPTVERPDLTDLGRGPIAFTVRLEGPSLPSVQLCVARPGRPRIWTTIARAVQRPVGMGAVDELVGDKVRGWAACFQPGDDGLHVLVCDGGEVVGRTRPCLPRPDVASAIALDDALLGFEAHVPWRRSAFKRLTILGQTKDSRFPIGELGPHVHENGLFTQSFRYRQDLGFWR